MVSTAAYAAWYSGKDENEILDGLKFEMKTIVEMLEITPISGMPVMVDKSKGMELVGTRVPIRSIWKEYIYLNFTQWIKTAFEINENARQLNWILLKTSKNLARSLSLFIFQLQTLSQSDRFIIWSDSKK